MLVTQELKMITPTFGKLQGGEGNHNNLENICVVASQQFTISIHRMLFAIMGAFWCHPSSFDCINLALRFYGTEAKQ